MLKLPHRPFFRSIVPEGEKIRIRRTPDFAVGKNAQLDRITLPARKFNRRIRVHQRCDIVYFRKDIQAVCVAAETVTDNPVGEIGQINRAFRKAGGTPFAAVAVNDDLLRCALYRETSAGGVGCRPRQQHRSKQRQKETKYCVDRIMVFHFK
ncbi:hypothetical protein SDC9_187576 [bioreactor metagenome]|uniref:Uncharacterized protein n=1 Tax=bioreactor metagenome TaxID=1076179 RepID=A0A645HLY5_9ZZZZ